MSAEKRLGIIIQARMGSSRLPSKIMLPINGKPVFQYQIDRLKTLKYPLFIATTIKPQDDAVVDFALNNNLAYSRGSEDNVLARYYECAVKYQLNAIVRLTSDCPLIDAGIINEGIEQYLQADNQQLYLSNTIERTYPRGADFEIFSFQQLKEAYDNATDISDKEHVTPYIWKNKSGKESIVQYKQSRDYSAYRITLDTPEDFELIQKLIEVYQADQLNMMQICDVMTQHPELPLINNHIEQKKA